MLSWHFDVGSFCSKINSEVTKFLSGCDNKILNLCHRPLLFNHFCKVNAEKKSLSCSSFQGMPFELRVYVDRGWAWKVKVSMALKKSVFHKTDSTSESCVCVLIPGSPTHRPWSSSGPWPVRNQATQQVVSNRRANKTSSIFTTAPHHWHYRPSSTSCQISRGVRFS